VGKHQPFDNPEKFELEVFREAKGMSSRTISTGNFLLKIKYTVIYRT